MIARKDYRIDPVGRHWRNVYTVQASIRRLQQHFNEAQNEARFPFKRNRLRCVRCVNEKPQEMQALAFVA